MKYRLQVVVGLVLAIVGGVSVWLFFSRGAPEPPVPVEAVETGVRFASITGDVKVEREGTQGWVDADMSVVLQRNDRVRAGESASAVIVFADDTQVTVHPGGLLVIEKTPGVDERVPRVEPRVENGEADFRTGVEPDTGISSPHGRAVPDPDTEGSIQVDEGGTALEVRKGGAEVETETGQHVRLAPNERVQIDTGGVAGPKTTLPPAPIVMDVPRPPGLLISSVELRGDQLHLSGQTEPGVTLTVNGEPIQVQRDGSFGEHVVLEPGTTAVSIRATGRTGAVTQQTLPIRSGSPG
jgi:hypothetical protein